MRDVLSFRGWAKRLIVVSALVVVLVPVAAMGMSSFDDTAGTTFEADIEWMLGSGVTSGCGDGSNYCPDAGVTRGQMAAFMHRFSQYIDAEDGTPSSIDGDIVMSHHPANMTGGDPSDFGDYDGFDISSDSYATLALTGPASIGATTYALDSVEVCVASLEGAQGTLYLDALIGTASHENVSVDLEFDGCSTIEVNEPFIGASWSLQVDGDETTAVTVTQITSTWIQSDNTTLPPSIGPFENGR